MVILHRAGIVVQQRQRVAGLDQEVIVHASMLIVVDDGRQVTSQQLGQEQVITLSSREGKGEMHPYE